MENKEQIDLALKSEPMSDMISQPPSWLTRSGSMVFLILIALFGGLGWLIEYPDEIHGTVTVSNSIPPIELRNQEYLKLERLNVEDRQKVKKNTLLAQFNSEADPLSIKIVRKYLDSIDGTIYKHGHQVPQLRKKVDLGTMQEDFVKLDLLIKEWNDLHKNHVFEKKTKHIQNEINFRRQLSFISAKKIKVAEADYGLLNENAKIAAQLASDSIISKIDLNTEKRGENQAFQALQSQKEGYLQNQIALNDLEKQLDLTIFDNEQQLARHRSDIKSSIASLKTKLLHWEKNAFWISPCQGQILFNAQLQINKYYKASEASMVIVPDGNDLVGVASIRSDGAGKIDIGQDALIEMADYPRNEFGYIHANVEKIALIDNNGFYEIKLGINNLTTTYNKQIPLPAKMTGTVKIITKKKKLLERLFEKLLDLLNN